MAAQFRPMSLVSVSTRESPAALDMRDKSKAHVAGWTLGLFDEGTCHSLLPRLVRMGLERRWWMISAVSVYALSWVDFGLLDDRLVFLRSMCTNEAEREVVDRLGVAMRNLGKPERSHWDEDDDLLAKQVRFDMCDVSRRYIAGFVEGLFDEHQCRSVLSRLAAMRTEIAIATLAAIRAYAGSCVRHDDWTYLMAYLCSMYWSMAEVKVLDRLHLSLCDNALIEAGASPDTWGSMGASRQYVADLARELFDGTECRRVLSRLATMDPMMLVVVTDAVMMYAWSCIGRDSCMCLVAYLGSMELHETDVKVLNHLQYPLWGTIFSRPLTLECERGIALPDVWADMRSTSKAYVADLTSKLFNEAEYCRVLSRLAEMEPKRLHGVLCAVVLYARGCVWHNDFVYLIAHLSSMRLNEVEVDVLSKLHNLNKSILEAGELVCFDDLSEAGDRGTVEGETVSLVDGLFSMGRCCHVLSRLAEMEPTALVATTQAIKAYAAGRVTRDVWACLIAYLYSMNLSRSEMEILGRFHPCWVRKSPPIEKQIM
ncbi:MAG: hypothetical protein LBF26_00715 [Puniceicoccales bacterium]|nr:hypothetical protein [Puniceicoccales bacterium]